MTSVDVTSSADCAVEVTVDLPVAVPVVAVDLPAAVPLITVDVCPPAVRITSLEDDAGT